MKRIIKKGFTFAELIITLGIIGVIAALTLPSLACDSKYKELGVKLSKFASTTENATLAWVAMNGNFEATRTKKQTYVDEDGNEHTKNVVNTYDNTIPDYINETFKFTKIYTDKNVIKKDNVYPDPNDDDKVGLRSLDYPYGILRDGTSANFRYIWAELDTNKYPEDKYGKTAFAVTYTPNVKGLPKDGQTVFIFAITQKGYVLPTTKDTCLSAISNDNWNVKSQLYTKTTGVCNVNSKIKKIS